MIFVDANVFPRALTRSPHPDVQRMNQIALPRALDLWMADPNLVFVDALTAAYVQHTGVELATFDTDFDHLPDITRWRPENGGVPR